MRRGGEAVEGPGWQGGPRGTAPRGGGRGQPALITKRIETRAPAESLQVDRVPDSEDKDRRKGDGIVELRHSVIVENLHTSGGPRGTGAARSPRRAKATHGGDLRKAEHRVRLVHWLIT